MIKPCTNAMMSCPGVRKTPLIRTKALGCVAQPPAGGLNLDRDSTCAYAHGQEHTENTLGHVHGVRASIVPHARLCLSAHCCGFWNGIQLGVSSTVAIRVVLVRPLHALSFFLAMFVPCGGTRVAAEVWNSPSRMRLWLQQRHGRRDPDVI